MFADSTAAATLWTQLSSEDKSATLDLQLDYLRPAKLESLIGKGEVQMLNNSVANVRITMYNESAPDEPLATGRAMFAVRRASA